MENIAGCNRAGHCPKIQISNKQNSPSLNQTCFDDDDWTTNAANAVSLAFDNMDELINLFKSESAN